MNTLLDLLVSDEEIQQKIMQIGRQIDLDYSGKELCIVMVMKGAICLVADLIRNIHIPSSFEFVQASSYSARGKEQGELALFGLENLTIAGKHVLVVDDIFDSGRTLSTIVSHLERKTPKSLRSLVLLSKNAPRDIRYRPDYVLFEIENLFVVGYGLDYKENYRGLPGVYSLIMED